MLHQKPSCFGYLQSTTFTHSLNERWQVCKHSKLKLKLKNVWCKLETKTISCLTAEINTFHNVQLLLWRWIFSVSSFNHSLFGFFCFVLFFTISQHLAISWGRLADKLAIRRRFSVWHYIPLRKEKWIIYNNNIHPATSSYLDQPLVIGEYTFSRPAWLGLSSQFHSD